MKRSATMTDMFMMCMFNMDTICHADFFDVLS